MWALLSSSSVTFHFSAVLAVSVLERFESESTDGDEEGLQRKRVIYRKQVSAVWGHSLDLKMELDLKGAGLRHEACQMAARLPHRSDVYFVLIVVVLVIVVIVVVLVIVVIVVIVVVIIENTPSVTDFCIFLWCLLSVRRCLRSEASVKASPQICHSVWDHTDFSLSASFSRSPQTMFTMFSFNYLLLNFNDLWPFWSRLRSILLFLLVCYMFK